MAETTNEDFYKENADGVEMHGPFHEYYKLTVNGYEVPHLRALLAPGTEAHWNVWIEGGPSMIQAPDGEVRRWLPFIANAMAVAAGYSSHGEHSGRNNPYSHRLIGITSVETDTAGD